MATRFLAVVLAFTVACGTKAPDAPLPKETNVELIKRGAAPFTELRYRMPKGSTMKLDVGVSSVMAGRTTPKVTTTMAFVVEDVAPDGRMTLRSTVERSVGAMPDGTAVPAEMTGMFDGTQLVGTMSPVGTMTDTKVVPGPRPLPAELAEQLASLPKLFEQAAMPLPNAPVGVGATWRTRKAIDENGVKITATTTTTITQITGTSISYDRVTTLVGPDQDIARGDVNVALTELAGNGHGTGTLDLATFAITSESEDAYTAKVRDKRAPDGQPEPFGVSMTLTMTPAK